MKKLLPLLLLVFSVAQVANAQDCDKLELQYYKFYKVKDYKQAYPIWKQAYDQCAAKKVNVYNHGELILEDFIKNAATEADKQKYLVELGQLIDDRVKNFPDGKAAFWAGEKINYQLEHGGIDKIQAYEGYANLFGMEDTQKLSTTTISNYFKISLELLNEGKLDFDKVLDVYFQTKKVTEKNIEIRSEIVGVLAEKEDSLKKMTPPKKLSKVEKQKKENAQAAKDEFVRISEVMEPVLANYTTCDNLAPKFIKEYEVNKDSMEWLTESYNSLASKECFDQPIMEQIEKQYATLWKKEHPQEVAAGATGPKKSSGGVSSCYGEAARLYKKGSYSAAIDKFKCALNEVSGSKKGDVAYYIALSYQKTGSLSNARSWAQKAANYKPGWGAPYLLIAGVFGGNPNSCGSDPATKLLAYWVAADYARKACAVDSRSCGSAQKYIKSYEANGPSAQQTFQKGWSKGQTVSISCFGGASTRIR